MGLINKRVFACVPVKREEHNTISVSYLHC